jgi:hypothetical protein
VVAREVALGPLQLQIIPAGQQLRVIVMGLQVLVIQAAMEFYRQVLTHLVAAEEPAARAKHRLLIHQLLEMAALEKKVLLLDHQFFMQAEEVAGKLQPRMVAQADQAAAET